MQRRRLLALLTLAPALARAQAPAPPGPPVRRTPLDAWWDRQREKEAEERRRNAPGEARRALTRDQFERWNRQNDRRRGIAPYPF
ncbi:hypothetical protein QWZ14_27045 [Paeniroseomonas aquatica]|uniref:DUF3106 domain-containing protein n=1 Tax=Paeniroseomonas aquatica TaxID=373043 RepID=A0ABT8AE18_9PROT|nr:hypothetical protein [Paeniroseomonas aquatica]MDN3568054.1 hypothetical protein [Paeniroseomonas aquatica]